MNFRPAQSVMRTTLFFVSALTLAACADPPDLDDSVDPALEQADYPDLVPIEQILGNTQPDPEADAETADRLEARAAGLQSRARQLQRQDGIDADTRRRLNSSIPTD